VRPQRGWTRRWVSYCCPTAEKPPNILSKAFLFLWFLQEEQRADERTLVSEKYYVPGIGIVAERNLSGGPENIELLKVSHEG
jgi:hypothetical protein